MPTSKTLLLFRGKALLPPTSKTLLLLMCKTLLLKTRTWFKTVRHDAITIPTNHQIQYDMIPMCKNLRPHATIR